MKCLGDKINGVSAKPGANGLHTARHQLLDLGILFRMRERPFVIDIYSYNCAFRVHSAAGENPEQNLRGCNKQHFAHTRILSGKISACPSLDAGVAPTQLYRKTLNNK